MAEDFDLKQHDSLRQEIQTAEAAARSNELYAIAALAALWAWTAKEAPSTGLMVGLISAFIGVLGGLRTWALWINMATKARYVAHIERLFARNELGGWEHYFRDATLDHTTIPSRSVEEEERRPWHRRPGAIGYTSAAFWVLIVVVSIPFGLVVQSLPEKTPTEAPIKVECVSAPRG